MLKAPTFLFPSYTVFIDDDILYPELITSDITNCPPIACRENFDFIIEQKDNDFLFLKTDTHKDSADIFMTLNDSLGSKTNSLPDLISVLIVDLNMKGLSGLDLLAQIKSPFVYKILISNYIGPKYEDAVQQAQNIGIIDEVIQKEIGLKDALPRIIYRGQTQFFTKLSNQIFAGKESHDYLSDSNVAKKFLEMIAKLQPQSIWPEPDLASFTLSSKQNSPSRVFFTTQNEIDALLACYDSNQIPQQTLKRLKNGDYIICHKNPHTLDIDEWPYFLRPAHKIDGINRTVFYHLTTENEVA